MCAEFALEFKRISFYYCNKRNSLIIQLVTLQHLMVPYMCKILWIIVISVFSCKFEQLRPSCRRRQSAAAIFSRNNNVNNEHRHMGQFSYGGEPSLPKKYFDSAQKGVHLSFD